jgi:acyl-CoA synthetase (AMP-forming)/AMP-acid ligase II
MAGRNTLVEVLRDHAVRLGDRPALTFVADLRAEPAGRSLSYQELDLAARRLAGWLQQSRYAAGDRAMLVYPSGLEFAVAMVACWYAGVIAVPTATPGVSAPSHRRATRVARDADVAVILTDSRSLAGVLAWRSEASLRRVQCVATDRISSDPDAWTPPPITPESLALLQYTSGSTGEPRGVMVGHDTVLAQIATTRRVMAVSERTRFGGWLPMHHDLGLMSQLLQPLTLGATSVFMPPVEFLKRPVRWPQLIDAHRIEASLAPNFAYDLCRRAVTDAQLARLDLSGWEIAGVGAETVRASTLASFAERFAVAGFRPQAVTVGYGLAESMVYSSAGRRDDPPVVCHVDPDRLEKHEFVPDATRGRAKVSCGRPCEVEVRIVDPETTQPLPDGRVGEIWLRGPAIARGYWAAPEATRCTFGAVTAAGDGAYLRTGDLGTMHQGELYVTGRTAEILIVRGRNVYPQDIEDDVASWDEALEAGAGAVFTVTEPADRVVVVYECRTVTRPAALTTLVRERLAREHGIRAGGVVLVRAGGIARTTSGKVRRSVVREEFLTGRLKAVYEDIDPDLRDAGALTNVQ